VAAIVGAAVGFLARTGDGDEANVREKPISSPLLKGLVGDWVTTSKNEHGEGRGRSSFHLGAGGTVLVQEYESTSPGPGGKEVEAHGIGIYKVAADGATLTVWWFHDHAPEPVRVTGPLSTGGADLSGESPQGKLRVLIEAKDEAAELRILVGDKTVLEETLRPALG
jgi:hypothetical protein